MIRRELKAPGQGVYNYDYSNDVLAFKIKDREYSESLEFDNLVLDIDTEGFITGMRIFDASKVFKLKKIALRKVSEFEFNTHVENKVITLQLRFKAVLRNKEVIRQGQDFERTALESNINDSKVECTVAA